MGLYFFTSESVSKGHPDKLADQVSDSILDAILEQDSTARVAAEALAKTGLVVLAGKTATTANVDYILTICKPGKGLAKSAAFYVRQKLHFQHSA